MPGILIADDLPIIRSGIAHILNQYQAPFQPILQAADGEEAVQLASRFKPDIILMDIKMPNLTGLQAAAMIRAENPNVKVVMLTAYDEFSYIQKSLKLGARDYLLKPVRPAKLIELLDEIQKEIEAEKRDQRTIEIVKDSLQKTMPVFEANLLESLIRGTYPEIDMTKESIAYLGKELNKPAVIVAKIDNLDSFALGKNAKELQQIYLTMVEIVRNLLPEPNRALVGYSTPGRVIAILSCDRYLSSNKNIVDLAEQIRQAIYAELFFTVTIGIGNIYPDFESVPLSYAEANLARRYQSYLGGNTTAHIVDALELSLNRDTDYDYCIQREQDIINSIQSIDHERVMRLTDEIVDYLSQRYKSNLEGFKNSCAELVTLVASAIIGSNYDQQNVLKILHSQVINLNSHDSMLEIRQWTMNSMAEFLAIIQARSRNKNEVAQAVEYIQANYQRSDISLKEVAQKVHLSQSYLASQLKITLGVSYIKYLTSLRIEEAKRLLRTTDLNIGYIGEKVGYPNATNFYRHFQRQEGKTPAAYRQMES